MTNEWYIANCKVFNFIQDLKVHEALLVILGDETFESAIDLPDQFLYLFNKLHSSNNDVHADFFMNEVTGMLEEFKFTSKDTQSVIGKYKVSKINYVDNFDHKVFDFPSTCNITDVHNDLQSFNRIFLK